MRHLRNAFLLHAALLFLVIPSATFASEKEIHELLNLPEDKLDIGRAALIVAKEFYPKLDVNAYSAKIDDMVKMAAFYAKGTKDPDIRIRAIITVFYKHGMKYDLSDPYMKKRSNKYLNGLIDTNKGSCVSMPTLFLAIAPRLGYPIYGMKAPDHFFLKYVDSHYKESNIDITAGGGYAPDEDYVIQFKIPQRAIESGEYLRPLTHRQFIAELVTGAAIDWQRSGDLNRAIRYFEHAWEVFPRSGGINDVLGHAYLLSADEIRNNYEAKKIRDMGTYHIERAKELGFVRLPMEEYAKKLIAMSESETKGNKMDKK